MIGNRQCSSQGVMEPQVREVLPYVTLEGNARKGAGPAHTCLRLSVLIWRKKCLETSF